VLALLIGTLGNIGGRGFGLHCAWVAALVNLALQFAGALLGLGDGPGVRAADGQPHSLRLKPALEHVGRLAGWRHP